TQKNSAPVAASDALFRPIVLHREAAGVIYTAQKVCSCASIRSTFPSNRPSYRIPCAENLHFSVAPQSLE
ncbi:unnamed protein product, partial [Ceratitis capitata]